MPSPAPFGDYDIGRLITALERGNVVHYTHVSTACLVVYEYLTTLDDEIALVWHARWGAGKILYLMSRYPIWPEMVAIVYNNLFDTQPRTCQIFFAYVSWSALAGITIAEVILVMRTWALWGAKRAMLISLIVLLVCVTATNAFLMSPFVKNAVFISAATYIPGAAGCILTTTSDRIALAWLSVTIFELGIVVLTLIKAVAHFRMRSLSSDLISSLYRDGVLYFLYLCGISVSNVLVLYAAPEEYLVLIGVPQRAFHAILACRIILHLRAASASPKNTPISLATRSDLPSALSGF